MENVSIIDETAAYAAKQKRKKVLSYILHGVIFAFLCIWAFIAIFPFVWVVLSSFKERFSVVNEPLTFKFSAFILDNYRKIFSGSMNVGIAYLNSFFISGLTVFFTVLFAMLAAFTMARFKFKGKFIVEALIIACMMFPAFSLLFPVIKILGALQLYGEQIGVVLPQIALNLGFTTTLLIGFFKSLPLEVEEAAYIDGSSIVRTLFTICLPMAKPAIVTSMIFVFIWSYNDLFLQMIIIQQEAKYPVSLLLNKLATKESGFDYGKMAAATAVVSLPIIIVYLFLQRYIIKGLTAGAVKG